MVFSVMELRRSSVNEWMTIRMEGKERRYDEYVLYVGAGFECLDDGFVQCVSHLVPRCVWHTEVQNGT